MTFIDFISFVKKGNIKSTTQAVVDRLFNGEQLITALVEACQKKDFNIVKILLLGNHRVEPQNFLTSAAKQKLLGNPIYSNTIPDAYLSKLCETTPEILSLLSDCGFGSVIPQLIPLLRNNLPLLIWLAEQKLIPSNTSPSSHFLIHGNDLTYITTHQLLRKLHATTADLNFSVGVYSPKLKAVDDAYHPTLERMAANNNRYDLRTYLKTNLLSQGDVNSCFKEAFECESAGFIDELFLAGYRPDTDINDLLEVNINDPFANDLVSIMVHHQFKFTGTPKSMRFISFNTGPLDLYSYFACGLITNHPFVLAHALEARDPNFAAIAIADMILAGVKFTPDDIALVQSKNKLPCMEVLRVLSTSGTGHDIRQTEGSISTMAVVAVGNSAAGQSGSGGIVVKFEDPRRKQLEKQILETTRSF